MAFNQKELEVFIGRTFTLPLTLVGGRPLLETGFNLLRASIKMILAWPIGVRFFLPEFGSRLDDLLEEPNDEVLKGLVETFVIDAIAQWERRIEVIDIQIERPTAGQIDLQLTYRVVATERTDTFIFPFYRQIIY